jgi:class 3 adenylate cyclase
VGVNTGVIVGGIVSGGDRMGYKVHGDEVNLAARLEQMNKEKGTRILVSKRTVELAGDVASFTSVGQVKVRGLQKPVAIYTPAITSICR